MGQKHILLGTESVVEDLVQGRGAIYNSRPQAPAASILTQDLNVLLMPQGKKLRERRGLLSQLLTRSAASNYEPYQWLETYRMVLDIVQKPSEYGQIFDLWSTAMGSRMLYGQAMASSDDFEAEIMDVIHTVEQILQPGAYLVDVLPWMRHLPEAIAPWKRYIKRMSRRDEALFYKLWNCTRSDLDRGRDVPSWARLCIEDVFSGNGKSSMTELDAVHLMGVTYTAFGTSSANLKIFIFALTRHPEWWSRLRAEMDHVVGGDRLPTLNDLPKLLILRAFLIEMTRVWPVTPGGVPHFLSKDDVYNGYHLPAGSVVHLVTWACGRDPQRYPDPDTFKPERWLTPGFPTYKEPLTEFPTLQNTLMFGAGRRQCPGMLVGQRNIYIQAMMLVWACEIGRARDAAGQEIIPPIYDFVKGFNVFPKTFKFDLHARSQARIEMVEAEYTRALAKDPMSV